MAGFCSNCGAEVKKGAKFCASCGHALTHTQPDIQPPLPQVHQQQAMQPTQPGSQQHVQQPIVQVQQQVAPSAVKKKGRFPFIIAGAAVLAVALVAALIVTKGFGRFGESDDSDSMANSAETTNVPMNAPGEEQIAYMYIESVVSVFEVGHEYTEAGLVIAAEYPYGTAAASICAMRYAVDCLLEMKGAVPAQDDRLRDWDEIAALGWASPYPYVFEGVVLEAGGDKDAAMSCYEKAALNPGISRDDHYLRYIILLDTEQLQRLRSALTEIEDRIFAVYGPMPTGIPRSEYNYDAAYLRGQGIKALEESEADETDETDKTEESVVADYTAVLQYYHAALSLEPFNGNNYASLAALYMQIEDSEAAIRWLNEGLFIDPENEALNALREAMEGVLGQ